MYIYKNIDFFANTILQNINGGLLEAFAYFYKLWVNRSLFTSIILLEPAPPAVTGINSGDAMVASF